MKEIKEIEIVSWGLVKINGYSTKFRLQDLGTESGRPSLIVWEEYGRWREVLIEDASGVPMDVLCITIRLYAAANPWSLFS